MKFGIVSLWRHSAAAFVDEIASAEGWGFDLIGVGDTQGGYRELYVSLTLAALNTSRAAIGPMVTNPVTRHPSVTASALAALDQLSGGRVVMGIGTGGSAVWSIGRRPAKIDELRSYIEAVRSLMTRGESTQDGHRVVMRSTGRAVPVFMSAEGPRALRLAGALADGVVLHTGTSAEAISWCLSALAAGATQAGRDPAEIEVWMMLKASVADSRDAALRGVKAGLAGSAEHALRTGAADKGVPSHLLGPVRELLSRYDVDQHAVAASPNGDLIDELGLTDFLADHFGLIGTAQECVARLRVLEERGIQGVLLPAAGTDPLDLITRLGRDVLPIVRERR
jgi:5,10-methylenetetrahydromethanopterin reductase